MSIAPEVVLPAAAARDISRDELLVHLADAARLIRRQSLSMVREAGLGHVGGDLSAADIVTVLYLAVLNVDPTNPNAPGRDRFIMSKGHASGLLYTALASRGFIPAALLHDYMKPLSKLNGHPDRKKVQGVEANTGPLGHGLPIAVGVAIAGKLDALPYRTFCLVGDGELQEGSNWEAFMAAGHRQLERLTVIVDRNGLQQGAPTEATSGLEPLADKARAFRWNVVEVDGHDHGALFDVLSEVPASGKPTFVIAHTHKSYPISFMQDEVKWHNSLPSADEFEAALEELS
jgi:transketolase